MPLTRLVKGKKGELITIDNPAVILSAFKKAASKDGYIIRVYESAGKKAKRI
ncbi:MAG: glycosyl hydrolase-related protein [Eisenbergiella massiliensis]